MTEIIRRNFYRVRLVGTGNHVITVPAELEVGTQMLMLQYDDGHLEYREVKK